MRLCATFLALLVAACSDASPDPPPLGPRPASSTSIDHCLVDGRSLEFDYEVRHWWSHVLADAREKGTTVYPFNAKPGPARVDSLGGSMYRYTTEFTFVRVGDGYEVVVLAVGTVDAATCAAILEEPEPPHPPGAAHD